jgi:hypothetical protein
VDGLDRPHGIEPALPFLPADGEQRILDVPSVPAVGPREVTDQAAVADLQRVGRDAGLDAGEQPAHRAPVADADVGQPVPVDVGQRQQQVDGPAQVDDELDLLVAVALVHPQRDAAAPGRPRRGRRPVERRVDGDDHRPPPCQSQRSGVQAAAIRRHAVLQDHAGLRAAALRPNLWQNERRRHPAALRARVREVDAGRGSLPPPPLFADIERCGRVVFEQGQALLGVNGREGLIQRIIGPKIARRGSARISRARAEKDGDGQKNGGNGQTLDCAHLLLRRLGLLPKQPPRNCR